ncbi:hypothetical protein CR513_15252, partial [Mucuna pruriens]
MSTIECYKDATSYHQPYFGFLKKKLPRVLRYLKRTTNIGMLYENFMTINDMATMITIGNVFE